MKSKRLGKGLKALIPEDVSLSDNDKQLLEIDVALVNVPYQTITARAEKFYSRKRSDTTDYGKTRKWPLRAYCR